MQPIVQTKMKKNLPNLGLTYSSEPLHMDFGVVSPCSECSNKDCPRKHAEDYEELYAPFVEILEGSDNPVKSGNAALEGMVFVFVALARKNLISGSGHSAYNSLGAIVAAATGAPLGTMTSSSGPSTKVVYSWDEDVTQIACEPFPVPCIFNVATMGRLFGPDLKEKEWVTLFYPGDTVYNGIVFPASIYGTSQNASQILSAVYQDYEVTTLM